MGENVEKKLGSLPPQVQAFLQRNGINQNNTLKVFKRSNTRSLSIRLLTLGEVAKYQNNQDYIVAFCSSSQLPNSINNIVFAAKVSDICQLAGRQNFRSDFIRNGRKHNGSIFLNFNSTNRISMNTVQGAGTIIYNEF